MASRKPRALAVVSALVALGLTACSSSAGEPGPTGSPSPDPSPPPPSTPTESEPTAEEQVIAVWESFHAERLRQLASQDDPDPTRFEDLATEQATEAVIDLIFIGRGDVPFVITDFELWPEAEVAAGQDRATVSDCIIIAERAASQPDADPTVRSQVWTGTVISTDAGWRIDQITPGVSNCVPPELNRQLLTSYREWLDAHNEWWGAPDPDPATWALPNPDHPLITRFMIGAGLEDLRDQLTEGREQGYVFREPHDPANAVVFELGIGSARIVDCHEAHPDRGIYDLATGSRLEDRIPAPSPGQTNAITVDLRRTEGAIWKIEGWRTTRDSDCTPGETPYVLAP